MYGGEGYSRGHEEFLIRGRDRDFLVKPMRTEHGTRAIFPNTAHMPPDSAYDKRRPSWASVAKMIDTRIKTPMLRRTPESISDTIIEDGVYTPQDDQSIIGVF
jgi:hypothetical protein